MNSQPLYLECITVNSSSFLLIYDSIYQQQTEWRSFIKIYDGIDCVFTSGLCRKYVVSSSCLAILTTSAFADIQTVPVVKNQIDYGIGRLRLHGDVIIRCYQIVDYDSARQHNKNSKLLFSLQFHTCAVTSRSLLFPLDQLDYASDGEQLRNFFIFLHW